MRLNRNTIACGRRNPDTIMAMKSTPVIVRTIRFLVLLLIFLQLKDRLGTVRPKPAVIVICCFRQPVYRLPTV